MRVAATSGRQDDPPFGGVRIGEMSRRVGVRADLLRAWERRYGLLDPARTPKGYRLYTSDDEARVRVMREQLGRGLSAAQAAQVARRVAPATAADHDTRPAPDRAAPSVAAAGAYRVDSRDRAAQALERALDAYDETGAHTAFDAVIGELSLPAVLRDVVLPYLARLGARWEAGTVDVAQEHFASTFLRWRLAGLALGWARGVGPHAVLACPPGEQHDLPLLIFGIALNRCGWRVTFLGADTPMEDLDTAVRRLRPDAVVLAAVSEDPFQEVAYRLRDLAARETVLLAGRGATPEVVAATGARALHGDPVTEAQRLGTPALPVGGTPLMTRPATR